MTEVNSQKMQTVLSEIDDQNNRNLFKMMFRKLTEKDEVIQFTNRVDDSERERIWSRSIVHQRIPFFTTFQMTKM